jgi:hypothetical protein
MDERRTIAELALRRFESPDEVRVFEKGRLELVSIGSLVLGRATYEPGWMSLELGVPPASRSDRTQKRCTDERWRRC